MAQRNDTSVPDYVVAQSAAASFFGPIQPMLGDNHVSITVQATGTPTGTLQLQVSDYPITDNPSNACATTDPYAGQFYNIPSSSIALAGAATVTGYNVSNLGCKYIRLVYTFTSGTGTISAAMTKRANSR